MSVAIAVGTVCFLLTLTFLAVTARRAIIASAKSWTPNFPSPDWKKRYLAEGSQVGRCDSKAPIELAWRSTRVISSRPFKSMSLAKESISKL